MNRPAVQSASLCSEINTFSRAGIHNILLDLSAFDFNSSVEWLTENEKNIYSNFGEPRKRSFLAGRAACKLLIKGSGTLASESSMNSIETTDTSSGRPAGFTVRGGDNYHLTLSHTDELALACAHTGPIGADIQLIKTDIVKISSKFASPDELNRSGSDPISLTAVWALKESFVKFSGITLFESFKGVKFLDRSADKIFFSAYGRESFAFYEVIGGHVACVLTENFLA